MLSVDYLGISDPQNLAALAAYDGLNRPQRVGGQRLPSTMPSRRHRRPVAASAVIGMDDHEMASVVDLTTIAQPVREQGARAARMLLDVLDGTLEGDPEVVVPRLASSRMVRATS